MSAVSAGQLNRRFSVQRPRGESPDSYDELAVVWGSKRFAGGNELLRFSTPATSGAWVLTIRYRNDLDASLRLVDLATDESFQITSFGDPDGKQNELRLYCVEAQ